MDVSGKGMQPDSLQLYTAGKKKTLRGFSHTDRLHKSDGTAI